MLISKRIMVELQKKLNTSTIYGQIKRIRQNAKNAISKEIAADIVAADNEIDVHKLLTKEGRLDELSEYKRVAASFDFS